MDHSMAEGNSTTAAQEYLDHPVIDPSYEYNPDTSGAYDDAGAEEDSDVEEGEAEGEAVEEDDEEADHAGSEGSSAEYDRNDDPEGYANRLDELAGVLEVREDEARALKWGPAMGEERHAPLLPLAEFKKLVNHHLTTTEWKYTKPDYSNTSGRPDLTQQQQRGSGVGGGEDGSWDTHPIWVVAPGVMGEQAARR